MTLSAAWPTCICSGLSKGTTLTLDGQSLFDQNDYKFFLGLKREDFGYLKLNISDFRTWYNGAGGFYPRTGTQYNLPQ